MARQHMSVLFGILEQGHQMLEALNEASGKAPSSPLQGRFWI
jgi:hypothetical protein